MTRDDGELWRAIESVRVQLSAIGTSVGQVVAHDVELDALKDSLHIHEKVVREGFARGERDAKERFDRVFHKLDNIQRQVQETNGRVTDLEKASAVDDALRQAAAVAVEERRKTLALQLAQHGWIRPAIAGAVTALLVTVLASLI
ncbi:MAG: hypothetical protein Q8O56_13945 [Solirubrobacteraceae bacterium]|nr:hypothetical protein [Solirubrobacteraceae bacterium]